MHFVHITKTKTFINENSTQREIEMKSCGEKKNVNLVYIARLWGEGARTIFLQIFYIKIVRETRGSKKQKNGAKMHRIVYLCNTQ